MDRDRILLGRIIFREIVISWRRRSRGLLWVPEIDRPALHCPAMFCRVILSTNWQLSGLSIFSGL
jgi:hypothetical protein